MTRQDGFFSKREGRPRAAVALAAVLCAVPLRAAGAAEATHWATGAHSGARLIEGGEAPADAAPGGALLAGLEVRLDPAFITYWRDPGDAGVPPVFDFAGSTNLKSAEVRYPAPERLDEAGAAAFGYRRDVTFPIVVVPADPSRPVGLHVDVNYAVCHDICLPARATLSLDLDRDASAEASRVGEALAAVPRPAALGDALGPLAILAVRPDAAGGFTVEAKAPRGATLFVEAPEAWSYAAGLGADTGAGRLAFPVKRIDAPQTAARAPVTLTLVAPGGADPAAGPPAAIEVRTQLDGSAKTP